ncbi:hypothetical protein [Noviherbaspirillum sp.]|uniref:hypothetical protein n=1 Tax=Noviherbaspirillum sp. TaxID=1926288 RepID=UPI002FE3E4FB
MRKSVDRSRLYARYEKLSRTRISKNFILRDFLFSTYAASIGASNFPEDPDMVVRAAKALCETLLEPILSKFGRFAITFAYQSREVIDAGLSRDERRSNPNSSNPHQFDRKTWGSDIYARIDILPYCVEDGEVTKHEFAQWLMHNLNVDLLMQWTRSNVFCLTISPMPRRVWIEWGNAALGEPRQTRHMGAHYWKNIYPTLPPIQRPKFGPSSTGGSLRWTID